MGVSLNTSAHHRMLTALTLLVAGASATPLHLVPVYRYFVPQQYGIPINPVVQPILVDINIDFECPSEGVFPDPKDCASYIACNPRPCDNPLNDACSGDPSIMLVPSRGKCNSIPGLAFNPVTKDCDVTANVGCVAPKAGWGGGGGGYQPLPQPVRVEADPQCEGLTTAGFVADPADCTSYFHCVGDGRAYPVTCPAGTIFSQLTRDLSPCVAGTCSASLQ